MKKKVYDEVSVIRSLSAKSDIYVNTVNKVIEVVRDSTTVGNGSWGKIDYLCKVHGYTYSFRAKLSKSKKSKIVITDDAPVINSKASKREAKLNMAAMTKAAMHKVNNHK